MKQLKSFIIIYSIWAIIFIPILEITKNDGLLHATWYVISLMSMLILAFIIGLNESCNISFDKYP